MKQENAQAGLIGMEGVTEQEALRRIEKFGKNIIRDRSQRKLVRIISDTFKEPMVLLLLGIGGIYISLGEIEEVVSLLTFLLLIVGITIIQDNKTEKTLQALKKLSSPRATVMRDGKIKNISGTDLVPGDLIYLSEGNRIPADIELLEKGPLILDESILTGESFTVNKGEGTDKFVFSGTLVVGGQSWGKVVATGGKTEVGRIGKSLSDEVTPKTTLQKQTHRTVIKLFKFASVLVAFIIFYAGIFHGNWLEALLIGLTLAMGIVPNELPAVLLIFLTMGAWRISRKNVLTRRIPAVEALGGISALCVDKTGTLTQNKMIVKTFWSERKLIDLSTAVVLPEAFHEILEFGILASHPQPFDPMEKAILSAGAAYLQNTEHLHPRWILSKEFPLSDNLLAVSYVWKPDQEQGYKIGAKGAPEAILSLCQISNSKKAEIEKMIETMASSGQRVIAVARARSLHLPDQLKKLSFTFVGLVGFTDPLRSDARSSVLECRAGGIKVFMITGDHPLTARNIGAQVGLENYDIAVTGPEIEKMDDAELKETLTRIRIFCRMKPLQKLRIVTALQEMGEIVAMTGDGVNDAPALKKADIGIAMGERGTDVAREAASIVILDDNFSSIVAAIKVGRQTFLKLQNAFLYLLTIHIPIIAVSILPVIFNLPLLLLPVHIAFLHLIIEPVSTIIYENQPPQEDVMTMQPRKIHVRLLSKDNIIQSLQQGIWMALVVLGVFFIMIRNNHTAEDVRSLSFTTLVLTNLALIFSNKSRNSLGKAGFSLGLLSAGTFLLLALVIYVPILRKLFRFEILHSRDLIICSTAALVMAGGLRIIKRINHISF